MRCGLWTLQNYFDGIFISSEHGVKKPDIRFFEKLLETYGICREQAIMIGNDGICDIEGAKEAGLAALYVHSNLSPEEDAPNADYLLEEMDPEKNDRDSAVLKNMKKLPIKSRHFSHILSAEPSLKGGFFMNQEELAIASVPIQHWGQIYEPDKAFCRGTIFPDLDKPFYVTETGGGGQVCLQSGLDPESHGKSGKKAGGIQPAADPGNFVCVG